MSNSNGGGRGGPPVDRNQQAKNDFALKQHQGQQRAFARDLAEGRTGMVDRIGQAVEIEALVLFKIPPMFDLVWTIEDVKPSLDPRHPVGTLLVQASCSIPMMVPAGVRQMNLVRVGHKGDDQAGRGVQAPQVQPDAVDEGPRDAGRRPIDIEGHEPPPPPDDEPPTEG
jgi:hypothetical protein